MAIPWTDEQRSNVQVQLTAHPVASGRCLEASRGILPVAQIRDAEARSWKVFPREGYFVVPRQSVGRRWFHHYTVEAELHCVDALTGADGTLRRLYLTEHWKYAESLGFAAVDLATEER